MALSRRLRAGAGAGPRLVYRRGQPRDSGAQPPVRQTRAGRRSHLRRRCGDVFEPDGALRARAPAVRARARAGRQSGCRGRGDVRHRQRVADISRGSDPDGQPRRGAACLRLWRACPASAERRAALRSALPGRAADARADAHAAGSAVRLLGSVHDPRAEGTPARAQTARPGRKSARRRAAGISE